MKGRKAEFVDQYMIDRNQTRAAIRAGYSEKTAAQTASRLMKDEEIKEEIERRIKKLHDERTAEADEVIEFLTSVMRGEKVDNIPMLIAQGLQEMKETAPAARDRLKAAEMLGKYYALFTDKTELGGDMDFSIRIDYGDDENGDSG